MPLIEKLDAIIRPHFVRPHGLVGHLAGCEMALRPSNRKRNRWAVDLLDVQSRDRVLEIGFGPGLAIRDLARRATDGIVVGMDHSDVMVRQATRRNRAAVRAGRVELRRASVVDLRTPNLLFDKVLVVNNFGMWPNPRSGLQDVLRALHPGGRVAIVSQPRGAGANATAADQASLETVERLQEAGFANARRRTLHLRPPVVCVLAEAPVQLNE